MQLDEWTYPHWKIGICRLGMVEVSIKAYGISIRSVQEDDIDMLTLWLDKDYILKYFIVTDRKTPIGFCQYYDCCHARNLEDWYSITKSNDIFRIDCFIGNDSYLNKG